MPRGYCPSHDWDELISIMSGQAAHLIDSTRNAVGENLGFLNSRI